MNTFITILFILGGLILAALILAVFLEKKYSTSSEIFIHASKQSVFDYLKCIKNQVNFNVWLMTDPEMKQTFSGVDGTVGFIYAWNGNKKAGEGEQEITAVVQSEFIEMEIRFVRPFSGIAHAKMTTESLSDNQTKVTWSTASTIKYPLNLMRPVIVKMLEKDMSVSLANLKKIVANDLNV